VETVIVCSATRTFRSYMGLGEALLVQDTGFPEPARRRGLGGVPVQMLTGRRPIAVRRSSLYYLARCHSCGWGVAETSSFGPRPRRLLEYVGLKP